MRNMLRHTVLGLWLFSWLALAQAAATQLPIESFARLPQVTYAALSPDGKWFAALVNRGDDTVAIARPVDGQAPPKSLLKTDNHDFRFGWLRWVNNERLVLSVQFPDKRGGTESTETRLVAVDRDGGKLITLVQRAPFSSLGISAQFQDQVVDWLPEDGHHILVQGNVDAKDISPAVFKVNVDTGSRESVHGRRFGVRRWLTDGTHRVRVGLQQIGSAVDVLVCDPDGTNWRTAWSYQRFDRATVIPLGFGADPDLLYITADHDGKTAAYRVDLRDPTLAKTLMLGADGRDVSGALVREPISGKAVGLSGVRYGDAAAGLWDEDAKALARAIDAALPGSSNRLLQFDADGSHYLIFSSGNGQPGRYLVGDRKRNEMSLLGQQYPELAPANLVRKQRLTVTARDGMQLPAYLTLPDGVAPRQLPTVVLPHGGPISMDSIDFDPLAEFLANRGYAVLQVDFRGSAGKGFDHMNAGLRRWGLEMQDDLTDSVKWLVDRGTADPARLCIVGGSYGGYAALMGGAKTPDLYRCVVSFAGVSDLVEMAYWKQKFVNGGEVFDLQVGSLSKDRQQLEDTSPQRLAQRFQVPVLLVHGSDDRVVPYAQSQAMAKALSAAGKPVKLVTLDGGDHQLGNAGDRLRFYRELEDFLAANLAVRDK